MKQATKPLELEVGGPSPRLSDDQRDVQIAAFVVQLVALSTGVRAGEIASAHRDCAGAARARQVAMYLTHTGCAWPLVRVAAAFGRDRSTISYACRRVEDLREDLDFDARMQQLERCIRTAPFNGARL